jgi:hypothetical protein
LRLSYNQMDYPMTFEAMAGKQVKQPPVQVMHVSEIQSSAVLPFLGT